MAQADLNNRDNQRRAEADRAAEQQRQQREAQQREEQRRQNQVAQQERQRVEPPKVYTYIRDDLRYEGVSTTSKDSACDAARKKAAKGPEVLFVKRVVSTGASCNCTGSSDDIRPLFVCHIPYTVEVASPYDPKAGPAGPSKGISK